MKLWDKGQETHKRIEEFTTGKDRSLDLHLAAYDVKASIAHAKMLGSVGLLDKKEADDLVDALGEIAESIDQGQFRIEEGFEDMHSKIEYLLTERLGDTGKKIHTARSRNDQVLVALHLYFKDELSGIQDSVKALFHELLQLAKKHRDDYLPGYTHLQQAMPSSFGLWFSAYAELLVDDIHFIKAAFKIADQNPLGSAAGYGSSFPINREYTTNSLDFHTMKYNSVAAQMSRGKVERSVGFAIASLASTLAKMAMDVCLYMNQNFGFISFPDQFTTGSSIMPHKKNPDVFELIRANCNRLQNLPNEIAMLTTNLPSGYHRDFQLLKEIILPGIREIKNNLEVATLAISQVQVKTDILKDGEYDLLYSVDAVHELVKSGLPFREAYKQVAEDIAAGKFTPPENLEHTHEGSMGNLCLDEIGRKMDAALATV